MNPSESKPNTNKEQPEESLTRSNSSLTAGMKIWNWNVTKNNLNWIFGLSAVAILILFGISCFNDNHNWIGNTIGIIGGLASVFGIFLTLSQLIETKKDVDYVTGIAQATQEANARTLKSLRKTMCIAQVAKFCEQIKQIQTYIDNNEPNIVILLIQELQEAVISLKTYLKFYKIKVDEEVFSNHITKMGMNITFIRTSIKQNNEKYKKEEIRKDFQELLNVMLELKANNS